MICEPFDVVVVPFPFTDREADRRRPALVVSSPDFNAIHDQSILAMITSAGGDWPSDVAIRDWREAGLSVPCKVRLKLFTLGRCAHPAQGRRLVGAGRGGRARGSGALPVRGDGRPARGGRKRHVRGAGTAAPVTARHPRGEKGQGRAGGGPGGESESDPPKVDVLGRSGAPDGAPSVPGAMIEAGRRAAAAAKAVKGRSSRTGAGQSERRMVEAPRRAPGEDRPGAADRTDAPRASR